MKKNKQQNQWEINEKKMEGMCDKFIEVLKKIDGYSGWESMLVQRIVRKLGEDSGLNGKPYVDGIIDTLEMEFNFRVLKCDSLAQEMKIESFLSEMAENPYQLKLIA